MRCVSYKPLTNAIKGLALAMTAVTAGTRYPKRRWLAVTCLHKRYDSLC